jgi:hypothetical protein
MDIAFPDNDRLFRRVESEIRHKDIVLIENELSTKQFSP